MSACQHEQSGICKSKFCNVKLCPYAHLVRIHDKVIDEDEDEIIEDVETDSEDIEDH